MPPSLWLILVLLGWPFYAVPTGVACALIRLWTRPMPAFIVTDWLLLVLPWVAWFSVAVTTLPSKSMANLAELYALIAVAVGGYAIRCLASASFGHRPMSAGVLAVATLAGFVLALSMPPLPE